MIGLFIAALLSLNMPQSWCTKQNFLIAFILFFIRSYLTFSFYFSLPLKNKALRVSSLVSSSPPLLAFFLTLILPANHELRK